MALRLMTFITEGKKNELEEKGPEALTDLVRTVMGWEETEESKHLPISRNEFIDAVVALLWLGLKQEERDDKEDQSLPN